MLTFSKYSSLNSLSENLKYHIINNIPLNESVFRYGSDAYFDLIREAKQNKHLLELSLFEEEMLSSDIGEFVTFNGKEVPLDFPMVEEELVEATSVKLNRPKRGGKKKFYVYVKNPKTKKVKKISFGDSTGLSVKINDPKARKSFVARHKCSIRNDKTKPSYWSCRIPYYAKMLGLSGGGSYFW